MTVSDASDPATRADMPAGSRRFCEPDVDVAAAIAESLATLPDLDVAELVPPGARAVIVAPHPDDEILGTGGLIRGLIAAGNPVSLIAITDGGASHPGSTAWPPERLTAVRPGETRAALTRLGVAGQVTMHRLGLTDGRLCEQTNVLLAALRDAINPTDVVFATWEYDGHPDHDAVGRCARTAVQACGARLVEVPITAWRWARPDDPRLPWARMRRLRLDDATVHAKGDALAAFTSQTTTDPSTGRGPILPPWALARMLRPFEVYFT